MILIGTVACGILVALLLHFSPHAPSPEPAPAPAKAEQSATLVACGEGCPSGQLCFDDPSVPGGACTTRCKKKSDCAEAWCCLDQGGAGDPAFFICAPPAACVGKVTGTPGG